MEADIKKMEDDLKKIEDNLKKMEDDKKRENGRQPQIFGKSKTTLIF